MSSLWGGKGVSKSAENGKGREEFSRKRENGIQRSFSGALLAGRGRNAPYIR